jgi:hypothetical protein
VICLNPKYKIQFINKKILTSTVKIPIEIILTTLRSISEAWKEIENGKGGKSKTSKFFAEFAKW